MGLSKHAETNERYGNRLNSRPIESCQTFLCRKNTTKNINIQPWALK